MPSEISGAVDSMLRRARNVLVACDFDGTLCPIASTPAEARVPGYMLDVLRNIAGSERLKLAIISGRALNDVVKRAPIGNVIFAGNHGLEIRGGGIVFEHADARRLRPALEQQCRDLAGIIERWRGAWVEDKYFSATVHYRGVSPSEHDNLRRAVRGYVVGRNASIGLRAASKALELYPKVRWDKGTALAYIREHSGPFDLSVAIGDDATDEHMFRECREISIKVGPGRSGLAAMQVAEPSGVAVFLQHLWDLCELRGQPETAGAAALAV